MFPLSQGTNLEQSRLAAVESEARDEDRPFKTLKTNQNASAATVHPLQSHKNVDRMRSLA